MKLSEKSIRNKYLFVLDVFLIALAYVLALLLMFPVADFGVYFVGGIKNLVFSILLYIILASAAKLYNIYWLHASIREYLHFLTVTICTGVVSGLLNAFLIHGISLPKFHISMHVMVAGMTAALRFAVKVACKRYSTLDKKPGKRLLIIGAGQLATILLRDIRDDERLNYSVVGLIDDDHNKYNHIMFGAKVLGTRNDIKRICKEKRVEEIIFAIYTADAKQKREILEICSETGCEVKILPGMESILSGQSGYASVRNIEIEDLLEREPILLGNQLIKGDICDKVVMVTGGGGSIGSELCRQIVRYRPKLLIILDIYENTTYELENELREQYPEQEIAVLIASVRDKKRLDDIFAEYHPELVFHAAAHKHVPLMEFSPAEAVKNNVFGTLNVAKCADEFGVRRFVMISTDKAVNPTNVMGATKRMCEMIVQTMSTVSKTDFVAVRFGNVLGSNGSVIPRFKKQIEAGGPVTVTHPEITRYFMTIPEAAHLVLQAAAYARGGEIFVLDMGKPVKIRDLAEKMIILAGYVPGKNIQIEYTGLRAGEKLYEELLMSEEGLRKTEHSKIFIGKPINLTEEELQQKLSVLKMALTKDNEAIKAALRQVVPTYVPPEETSVPNEEKIRA